MLFRSAENAAAYAAWDAARAAANAASYAAANAAAYAAEHSSECQQQRDDLLASCAYFGELK